MDSWQIFTVDQVSLLKLLVMCVMTFFTETYITMYSSIVNNATFISTLRDKTSQGQKIIGHDTVQDDPTKILLGFIMFSISDYMTQLY